MKAGTWKAQWDHLTRIKTEIELKLAEWRRKSDNPVDPKQWAAEYEQQGNRDLMIFFPIIFSFIKTI